MGYAHQRIGTATSYLSGDRDELRRRLARALTELVFQGADGLDEEETAELLAIREAGSSVDASDGEGNINATIAGFDDHEVQELTARVYAFYWRTRQG